MLGDSPIEIPRNKRIIPEDARRALHNIPAFYKKGVVIDLIEYEIEEHIGVRCYQNQVAGMPVEDRARLFERMNLMVGILRQHGVSASTEKVRGNPPAYERR
jgi:hypothetical protein